MKYAYISTISPGYMFSMNASMNANKYYGTNAEVHLLYSLIDKDYMKRCETAFPFKVKWIPLTDYGTSFHNAKYSYAASLKNEYDAVCLIDADLFICCDTKEYFKKVAKENVLISATHVWSGLEKEHMLFDDFKKVIDRGKAYLADFPVFVNPKFGEKMFNCWHKNTIETYVDISKEFAHPLVAFNRCVCKTMSSEQIIPLDGSLWVCDQNYWGVDYIRKGDKMVGREGKRVCAIHNKWWKLGVANGHFRAVAQHGDDGQAEWLERVNRGERNMNAIKDFMSWFNEMTPATRRDNYVKERIDGKKFLREKDLI